MAEEAREGEEQAIRGVEYADRGGDMHLGISSQIVTKKGCYFEEVGLENSGKGVKKSYNILTFFVTYGEM